MCEVIYKRVRQWNENVEMRSLSIGPNNGMGIGLSIGLDNATSLNINEVKNIIKVLSDWVNDYEIA